MFSPDVAVEAMHAARRTAEEAVELFDAGAELGDKTTLYDALGLLSNVLSSATELLTDIDPPIELSASSRKGMRPWLPEQRIDLLRTAIAIDNIAIEGLLKVKGEFNSEDERIIMQQITGLMRAIYMRAKSTRQIITEQWSDSWSLDLDIEFSRYLRPPQYKGPS